MKNETSIRIVSRLANSVFSFGINANYTQHSLKCNLSQHILVPVHQVPEVL
jgi:hypothetical protein